MEYFLYFCMVIVVYGMVGVGEGGNGEEIFDWDEWFFFQVVKDFLEVIFIVKVIVVGCV